MKLVDIAVHLEEAADALPDRVFSRTGELLSAQDPSPLERDAELKRDTEPEPHDAP